MIVLRESHGQKVEEWNVMESDLGGSTVVLTRATRAEAETEMLALKQAEPQRWLSIEGTVTEKTYVYLVSV